MWEVAYTDEFEEWWETLTESEQIDITSSVGLLEECGLTSNTHTHLVLIDQLIHICVN